MNIFSRKREPRRVADPSKFRRLVREERARQVEKGYTKEHDREHGPLHLMALAQVYGRLGEPVKAAALTDAAMDLIRDIGAMTQYIDIVFDHVPDETSAVFVEVEDADGAGMRFGTWITREDGYAALRINYWDAVAGLQIPGVHRG